MKPVVKVQLLANLKFLKLAAVIANLEACIRQAREASLDPSEFLLNITELEVAARMENGCKRRIREAKFPLIKPIDTGCTPHITLQALENGG